MLRHAFPRPFAVDQPPVDQPPAAEFPIAEWAVGGASVSTFPRRFLVGLAFLVMPLLTGCQGCRPAVPNEDDTNQEELANADAFTTEPAFVYPEDQNADRNAVKPGHWMTAEQPLRSNQTDERGELFSQARIDERAADGSSLRQVAGIEVVRPTVLPKGQMRGFDFRFRVPVPRSIQTRLMRLTSRLVPRSSGVLDDVSESFNVMRGSEYFFIVLTNRPSQFTRLQVADWAGTTGTMGAVDANYRLVIPKSEGLIALPETVLDMSSIAVILWDDLSEDALTPLQQKAIADWIHFGGRLIVNGPSASDAVANTTLAEWLPLLPTSNIELDPEAAKTLLKAHSVASDRSLEKQSELVESENSRIAVDGQLNRDAFALDQTGSLILAKRVGRGTVLQPRFDVTDNWISSWDSYDSFLNSVVLRRPPREYLKPTYAGDEEEGFKPTELRQVFAGTKLSADAAVNTQFRLTARDAMLGSASDPSANKINSPFDPYHRVDAMTGVAAWNDTSDAIELMRATLTDEAGIEIPDSSLVIKSLAIYLLVLVPLNYIFFRVINRLEYAWFAVPFIAIIGAALAARQAQLDIGFARSNTELSLLEAHAGYPRAHLTRMVGIYNSLSSRYEMHFPTADGAAAPLFNEPDPGTTERPVLRVSFDEGPALSNFAVPSNRMRYVHTEEMVDLGGAFAFDGTDRLTSNADFELYDAVVIRRTPSDRYEVASVGLLAPGEVTELQFRSTDTLMIPDGLPMQTSRLMRRLADSSRIPLGTARLVGRLDTSVPGLTITPRASQQTSQTVVLVHLQHGAERSAKPDLNLPSDFRRVNRLESTDGKEQSDTPNNDSETAEAAGKE